MVGLGANNFGTDFFGARCDQDDATRIIRSALDAGVNFIDTAEEYSVRGKFGGGESEQFIGHALKQLGVRRDDVVLATKFLPADAEDPDERGAKRIIRALEGSLRRLGIDYVDLYQQHRPDPETPIEETLGALDRLVQDGKVREIGCSNCPGPLLEQARAVSETQGVAGFVTTQNRYNILEAPREEGVLDACRDEQLALLPYYPLANGLLTGKYSRGTEASEGGRLLANTPISDRYRSSLLTPERLATVAKLDAFARDSGHTLLQLAICWLTSQPFVGSVIAGATRPEQIAANAASASWELSGVEFAEVARIVGEGDR